MKQIENNAVTDLLISFGTHAGMVGKNNEDFVAFAAFDSGIDDANKPVIVHLGIVADGVGGQTAGERASRLATDTVVSYFAELESLTVEQVDDHLHKAILKANTAVIEEANISPNLKGMATTIALAIILDGLLFTAHVGDSRIYLFRDEALSQLTNDHSWVQEALEAGIITNEEARTHPNRNIIRRSLGTINSVAIDQVMMSGPDNHFWQGMPLRKNDTLLICSDGLTDMISDFDVQLSIEKHTTQMSDLAVELIDKANLAGGKDNITVMTIKTSDNFSPNRLMPIPPTAKPVVHMSLAAPEQEHITLVGDSIDRNTVAPPTVRSMPTLTPDLIRTYSNHPSPNLTSQGYNPTIESLDSTPKNKRPTLRTYARATSLPIEEEDEDEQVQLTKSSAQLRVDETAESSTVQQFMIRFVIGLATVAGILAALMLILGRIFP